MWIQPLLCQHCQEKALNVKTSHTLPSVVATSAQAPEHWR